MCRTNRALIFDLDGVIVDTARYHYLAWKKVSEKLGFELTWAQNEELKGVSRLDSLSKILHWAGVIITQQEFKDLMDEKNQDYLLYVDRMTPDDILPGVYDFISQARQSGYSTAIGSASKNAPVILRKVNLLEAFDIIIDGNSVTNAKPDPEVFTKAADMLKIDYSECIVFEDSEAGIEAANVAGMTSIGIGTSDTLKGADWVFTGFPEITIEFINQLEK